MDSSPPGSCVPGISQAKIPEWVAIPFSRRSSWPRDRTHISCIGKQSLYHWATREAPKSNTTCQFLLSIASEAPLSLSLHITFFNQIMGRNRNAAWWRERWGQGCSSDKSFMLPILYRQSLMTVKMVLNLLEFVLVYEFACLFLLVKIISDFSSVEFSCVRLFAVLGHTVSKSTYTAVLFKHFTASWRSLNFPLGG